MKPTAGCPPILSFQHGNQKGLHPTGDYDQNLELRSMLKVFRWSLLKSHSPNARWIRRATVTVDVGEVRLERVGTVYNTEM